MKSLLSAVYLSSNLLLKDEYCLVFVFKSIMQIKQLRMMQMVHNIDLISNGGLFNVLWSVKELGHKCAPGVLLYCSVDYSKCTTVERL